MPRDWVAWHADYEGSTPLACRLAIVQEQVERALAERDDGPIRVLSLCSGDGRDLILPLSGRAPATAGNVRGRLVELDRTLARRWFAASGFRHEAFVRVPDGPGSVGVERFVGTPRPFEPGVRLFTFTVA